LTDFDLLVDLRSGSQEAFDAIFRAHYAALVGAAEMLLRDRGSAEEVVQDVMLELWRRRATVAIQTSLRAYLFRATRNRALNQLRHERVARLAEPRAAGESVAVPVADNDLLQHEIDAAVSEAVSALPARCREVFELSRVHGLRYAEIAATMDISVKTVEAQMGKALKLLRQRLARYLPR
jgi:RNA polymerase sigma-70 factor (ECF subfamily)